MLWIRLLNAMSRAEQSREQSPLVNLFDMQTTTKIAIMSHLHIKAKAVGACENTYLNTYVNTYTHAYIHSSIQYKESLDDIAKCNVSLQNQLSTTSFITFDGWLSRGFSAVFGQLTAIISITLHKAYILRYNRECARGEVRERVRQAGEHLQQLINSRSLCKFSH